VMLGIGPGQISSDAYMMGIDTAQQRYMMAESLDVIIRLLSGEVVTESTDWFTLQQARLQVSSFTKPHLEMAIASAVTPTGSRLAGRYGLRLLSVAASVPEGYSALDSNWGACEAAADEHGTTVDRANWRITAPIHLAPTREQAEAEVRDGLFALAQTWKTFQGLGDEDAGWASS